MRAESLIKAGFLFVFVLGAHVFAQPQNEGPHPVRLETTESTYVLFLDMKEVAKLENAELVVSAASKCAANPVLPLGDISEWDSLQARPWAGTILYDRVESLFKCWYFGMDHSENPVRGRTGYAVSADGLTWVKPKLGLIEYRGSRDNNILCEENKCTIDLDDREPDPAKRYKMIRPSRPTAGAKRTHRAFYSPDGLHWTPGPEILPDLSPVELSQLLIDPLESDPQRRVKVYGHAYGPVRNPSNKLGPSKVRKIVMGYGPDIEHVKMDPIPILDPDDGLEQELHFANVFPYRSYYIMLYDYNLYAEYYGHGKYGNFVGDIRLAVSRDGRHFERVNPHQPLVARGERREWDNGFVTCGVLIPFGDQLYIYYSATSESWSSFPAETNRGAEIVGRRPGYLYPSQMGMAALRPDGFTYLQARDGFGPGFITTVPIKVKDREKTQLRINASQLMPYRDWIEVEVLDASTGQKIVGYSRQNCVDVVAEGTSIAVNWQGRGEGLAGISALAIQLRFSLHGRARLHSFTFGKLK